MKVRYIRFPGPRVVIGRASTTFTANERMTIEVGKDYAFFKKGEECAYADISGAVWGPVVEAKEPDPMPDAGTTAIVAAPPVKKKRGRPPKVKPNE